MQFFLILRIKPHFEAFSPLGSREVMRNYDRCDRPAFEIKASKGTFDRMEHRIVIWGAPHTVQTRKSAANEWIAFGEFLGNRLRGCGRTQTCAIRAWVNRANRKGLARWPPSGAAEVMDCFV